MCLQIILHCVLTSAEQTTPILMSDQSLGGGNWQIHYKMIPCICLNSRSYSCHKVHQFNMQNTWWLIVTLVFFPVLETNEDNRLPFQHIWAFWAFLTHITSYSHTRGTPVTSDWLSAPSSCLVVYKHCTILPSCGSQYTDVLVCLKQTTTNKTHKTTLLISPFGTAEL